MYLYFYLSTSLPLAVCVLLSVCVCVCVCVYVRVCLFNGLLFKNRILYYSAEYSQHNILNIQVRKDDKNYYYLPSPCK